MAKSMEQQRIRDNALHPYATSTIRVHARRLARLQVMPSMAHEDYEQELALDLWRRLAAYQPERASLPTYIDRVVRNRAARFFMTARSAAYRHERQALAVHTIDETAVTQRVEQDDLTTPAESFTDAADLRSDLARFTASLPPALQRCCAILQSGATGEAIRQHGLHRSSHYDALRRLRRRAHDAGLHEYLTRGPRQFASDLSK
jgi:DNA-directed RNA polymerase specialized sigma24 family protein